MLEMRIKGHLLIPFGCPKWDIAKIKIVGVSTEATYFQSETPCVHVNKNDKSNAARLRYIKYYCPNDLPQRGPQYSDPIAALHVLRDYLISTSEIQTDYERRFLKCYFDFLEESVLPTPWHQDSCGGDLAKLPPPHNDPLWLFNALMPLPQAHLYLADPLTDDGLHVFAVPNRMVKVDFAFWTGTEIVAVEVDGASHLGSDNHITKDRALMRAGVHVVHVLNNELMEYGTRVIAKLLPVTITRFWEHVNEKSSTRKWLYNPLASLAP